MAGSILGNRVVRKEDSRFLTTGGVYLDDLAVAELAGAAHVVYVRSPVAHGVITAIDADDARAMPDVLAVLTGTDLGLQPVASPYNPAVARPLLAVDRVRYVGEPIAAAVAETREAATDAAQAVIVDIEPLPVQVDPEAALTGTPLYEAAGTNVVVDSTARGLPDVTGDEFFADCEVTASGRFVNQRVAPCPLEVRGSAVAWVGGRLHQWISTQHAHGVKEQFVAANGVGADDVRVITPDVGGGFGAKITTYPEEVVLGPIAKRLGRPVRWQETRSESMMALGHGRAQVQHVTIGGRRDGTVTHYEGQIHGGVAQGAAQALLEEVRYDDDGNPITSNLADYAMISAAELPSFEIVPMETPTPRNPLGVKGIGESGTIGSTPAVQSAVVDALAHLGVRHIDMPTTPERVWQALRAAR